LHLPFLQSALAGAVAPELLVVAFPGTLVAPVALVVEPPEPDDPEDPAPLPLPEPVVTTPAEELAVVSDAAGSVTVDSLELVLDGGSESDSDPCLTVQLARTRAPQMKLISAMCALFMLSLRSTRADSLRIRVSGRKRATL
jgi:hypothetical protein